MCYVSSFSRITRNRDCKMKDWETELHFLADFPLDPKDNEFMRFHSYVTKAYYLAKKTPKRLMHGEGGKS